MIGDLQSERLFLPTNLAPGVGPVRLEATLHLPQLLPAPAMVLLSSSGGVQRHREHHYARALNGAGIAALIIDSFKPRGVRNTVADQRLVTAWEMENDAFAALDALRHDERIDANRIGIMGVSKGGIAAIASAMVVRQAWRGTGTRAFAVHVAIVPGCTVQHRNPVTTGAPLLLQLAELDDYTPAPLCLAYAERIRAAGNARVTVKIYQGAHHGWESLGPVYDIAKAENFSRCRALIEDDGSYYVPQLDANMSADQYAEWARLNCAYRGDTKAGGGTPALKAQATEDLLSFLRSAGF